MKLLKSYPKNMWMKKLKCFGKKKKFKLERKLYYNEKLYIKSNQLKFIWILLYFIYLYIFKYVLFNILLIYSNNTVNILNSNYINISNITIYIPYPIYIYSLIPICKESTLLHHIKILFLVVQLKLTVPLFIHSKAMIILLINHQISINNNIRNKITTF